MNQILTRDEYLELCSPSPDDREYPKSAVKAAHELKARGAVVFDDEPDDGNRPPSGTSPEEKAAEKLKNLLRRKLLTVQESKQKARWTEDLIDQAAGYFDEKGQWLPELRACDVFGVKYAEYLRGLRHTHKVALDSYGPHRDTALAVLESEPNEAHFVKTFHPSIAGQPARVEFQVCDWIRYLVDERIAASQRSEPATDDPIQTLIDATKDPAVKKALRRQKEFWSAMAMMERFAKQKKNPSD